LKGSLPTLKGIKIPLVLSIHGGLDSPVALRDAMNDTLTWMKIYGEQNKAVNEKKMK
jgi:hypothetical protein